MSFSETNVFLFSLKIQNFIKNLCSSWNKGLWKAVEERNDLPPACTMARMAMYADDATLYTSAYSGGNYLGSQWIAAKCVWLDHW